MTPLLLVLIPAFAAVLLALTVHAYDTAHLAARVVRGLRRPGLHRAPGNLGGSMRDWQIRAVR